MTTKIEMHNSKIFSLVHVFICSNFTLTTHIPQDLKFDAAESSRAEHS
jgi:hypothetical protein